MEQIESNIEMMKNEWIAQVKGYTISVYALGNSGRANSYPEWSNCELYVGACPEDREWIRDYLSVSGYAENGLPMPHWMIDELKERGVNFQVSDFESNQWMPL